MSGLGAFTLQCVKDFLDAVSHDSNRERRAKLAPAQDHPAASALVEVDSIERGNQWGGHRLDPAGEACRVRVLFTH